MKNLMKKIITMLLSVCIVAGLAGCATETASNDEKKPVILAVSFGTSYNDSREATIGAVEKALGDANPDYEVRRAFTSQIVIDILKERDKLEIDNVTGVKWSSYNYFELMKLKEQGKISLDDYYEESAELWKK